MQFFLTFFIGQLWGGKEDYPSSVDFIRFVRNVPPNPFHHWVLERLSSKRQSYLDVEVDCKLILLCKGD
ncbi:hypothetical protein D2Q93_15905 [Alicyclobacillaceae bacterium I2511]|nr:hypothetical protein D2Q93_15905 [Alicyclobacillaceae bacterium I2511]